MIRWAQFPTNQTVYLRQLKLIHFHQQMIEHLNIAKLEIMSYHRSKGIPIMYLKVL